MDGPLAIDLQDLFLKSKLIFVCCGSESGFVPRRDKKNVQKRRMRKASFFVFPLISSPDAKFPLDWAGISILAFHLS